MLLPPSRPVLHCDLLFSLTLFGLSPSKSGFPLLRTPLSSYKNSQINFYFFYFLYLFYEIRFDVGYVCVYLVVVFMDLVGYRWLGMEPEVRVRGGKNINNFFFFFTLNKHSFSINKPSTKTNTQNFCFLIHQNALTSTHYTCRTSLNN